MEQPRFPQYRRSANGLNWYRIDSDLTLVEVQRIGKRYLVHRLQAAAYPEKVRIMALLAMENGHVEPCPAEEVERLLEAAG